MQMSAEYDAVTKQTFYAAKQAFLKAKAPKGKLKAVVVDLDETMIDNSPYEGSLIKEGAAFQRATWGGWEQNGHPKAMPGAKEFSNFVNAHGGKMYFVSNRSEANKAYTIKQLKALGFTGVDETTVLLKDKTSDKNIRFAEIAKQNPIVIYMGDNLNDFPGVYGKHTVKERKDYVLANEAKFGTSYFVLPNAMYGDWMRSLAPNWYNMSAAEQAEWKWKHVLDWKAYPYTKKQEKKD